MHSSITAAWRAPSASVTTARLVCKAIADVTGQFAQVTASLRSLDWDARIRALEAKATGMRLASKTECEERLAAWAVAVDKGAVPLERVEAALAQRQVAAEKAAAKCSELAELQPPRHRSAQEVLAVCAESFRSAELLAPQSSVKSACEDCVLLWDAVKNLDRGEGAKA